MGTVTTNYDLYKPAFGEQGYDDEMNDSQDIVDTVLKDHEDRLVTLETVSILRYDEQIITGADASTITITIPSGYRRARLVLVGRTDEVATFSTIRVQVNGDTGNNYDTEGDNGVGTTPLSFEYIGDVHWHVGWLTGASAPTDVAGSVDLELEDYERTIWQKTAKARSTVKTANSAGNVFILNTANFWRSTAAITSVVLSIETGGRKFKVGTVCTLYMYP